MKHKIDIEHWNRKEHFHFFSAMDDPFLGVTVQLDCRRTFDEAKETGQSFFLLSLFKIVQTVNAIEPFRYRIENNEVYCYDTIHVSSTVGRDDETFGYSFFEYFADKQKFIHSCEQEVERIKASSGTGHADLTPRNDLIFFTTTPWFHFTELKHAGSRNPDDSIPRISTGKFMRDGDKLLLPVSIVAHHGLMDGIHVGRFIERLQEII